MASREPLGFFSEFLGGPAKVERVGDRDLSSSA
jgi:hypothetical protein